MIPRSPFESCSFVRCRTGRSYLRQYCAVAFAALLLAAVLAWEWRFLLGERDRQLLYSLIPAR